MDKIPAKSTAPKTQDSVEFGSLEVHVALSRERHEEINSRFDRVEAHMVKIEDDVDKGFEKILKSLQLFLNLYSS